MQLLDISMKRLRNMELMHMRISIQMGEEAQSMKRVLQLLDF